MYNESQTTSGMDTQSQRTVRFEAVWHQLDSFTSEGAGGDATATECAVVAARRAKVLAVGDDARSGEELPGAGEAVDVRDDFFVGEGSKVGKLPRGVWRVETILTVLRWKRGLR
jgi:hypothetical protein